MSVTTLSLPHALPAAQPGRPARLLPRVAAPRRRMQPMSAGLDAEQRRVVIGIVFVLHVFGLWAVMQVSAVRQAVADAAPMFVDLLAPPAPPAPPPPVPVTPPRVMKAPPLVVATPKPQQEPSQFTAEPKPIPEPPVAVAAPVEAPPAPAQPAPPPKVIPASAVEYLEKVNPEYPRLSSRNRESGRVMVHVLIDERGLPATVQLHKSSGFSRLDDSALAAVKKWRFKPYTENGRPASGWAFIPLEFDLDR